MGAFTVGAFLFVLLIANSYCQRGYGSNRQPSSGFDFPRSNSGRTFGIDLGRNTDVYPEYHRPTGTFGLGIEHRFPNSGIKLNGGVGLDRGLNPGGHIGITIPFGRRRRRRNASERDIHGELFKVLDMNEDDQLDVVEWFIEGGKLPSFAALIESYDKDGDDMISLEEFLVVPLDPGLEIFINQLKSLDQPQTQNQEHGEE